MNIREDERIIKYIKVLLIIKAIEIEEKQQIMNFILISKFYEKIIDDLIYNSH